MRKTRRGFSLIELLVVIAIIALLVSILLPALGAARRSGRHAVCQSNLHQRAIAMVGYGHDFRDSIASFSWTMDDLRSRYADLNEPAPYNSAADSSSKAASRQATDIGRRLTGRDEFPYPLFWTPHVLYNHLVLDDYLSRALPEKSAVCPEDKARLEWAAQAATYPGNTETWRYPYSSSYAMVPASYSADTHHPVRGNTVSPGSQQLNLNMGAQSLGGRKHGEVWFPAAKVVMFDIIARHEKQPMFYAYPQAGQSLLFFDGSVRFVRSRDANAGRNPNLVYATKPLKVTYMPDVELRDPPPLNGEESEEIVARYQWTAGGLKGSDVNSRERKPQ